jgi:hypothetical protein
MSVYIRSWTTYRETGRVSTYDYRLRTEKLDECLHTITDYLRRNWTNVCTPSQTSRNKCYGYLGAWNELLSTGFQAWLVHVYQKMNPTHNIQGNGRRGDKRGRQRRLSNALQCMHSSVHCYVTYSCLFNVGLTGALVSGNSEKVK